MTKKTNVFTFDWQDDINRVWLTGLIIPDDILEFAWFDTVTGTFFEFNNSQTWTCWEEFEKDCIESKACLKEDIVRFKNIFNRKVSK